VVLVGLKPISMANWLPSVLWRRWLGHLACKIVPEMTYKVSSETLNLYSFTDLTLVSLELSFKNINPDALSGNIALSVKSGCPEIRPKF